MITQIATVMIMAAFYAAYFLKMINQRKAGISTVILGKGNKPQGVKVVEVRITIISIMVVLVELMSLARLRRGSGSLYLSSSDYQ